jgi:hypothetical protein
MFPILNPSKQDLKRLKIQLWPKKLHGTKQNHLGWMHGQSFKPITYKTKHQISV